MRPLHRRRPKTSHLAVLSAHLIDQISGPSRKSRSPTCSTRKLFFLTWPFYRPEKAADSFPTVLNPGLLAKNASPRSCFRYSPANDLEHPPIYPPLGPPSSIGTRVTCRAEVPALNCFLRREHFRDGALVSAPPRFGKWERRCRELGQMLSDSVSGPR